jgi:hypothetical protein
MKKKILSLLTLSCIIIFYLSPPAFSQEQKLAQTGMKFLSVTNDARAAGMGSAITALEGNSSSMFFNPAGMARLNSMISISSGNTSWIADINHIYGSIAFKPFDGDFGVIGLFFQSVDYGDLRGTIIAENEQGFLETGMFSPNAFAVGIGYAKALTDKFSIGGNVKYVAQDLGQTLVELSSDNLSLFENKANTFAFDLGILYHTGFKSLTFGMSIRNFSQETQFAEESFELPLTFKVSVAMNTLDLTEIDPDVHKLNFVVDAVQPRDYFQQVNVGAEYIFMNTIALRGGFSTPNDEHDFSAGVGVRQTLAGVYVAADYAYTPFTVFQDVHRITVNLGLF